MSQDKKKFVPSPPNIIRPQMSAPLGIGLKKLVLFLFTISCFYFGCGVYFNKIHINPEENTVGPDSSDQTPKKPVQKELRIRLRHGIDSFLIFFAWAITAVTDHSRYLWGISSYLIFLSAIFLYDLVWLLISLHLDSVQEIKMWAIVCTVVWFLGANCFWRKSVEK